MNKLLLKLLNLIYPSYCYVCHQHSIDGIICDICWGKVNLIKDPCCPKCGISFMSDISLSSSPDHICGECRKKKIYFTKAMAAGRYEGVLREAIHLYKYKKKITLKRRLGELLIDKVKKESLTADIIIPVPVHIKKLRIREFNQTYLLASELSKSIGIRLEGDCLIKSKWSLPQVEMDMNERKENVRDNFEIVHPELVKDKNIILLDDVFTTGSTVNECSRVLKKSRAKEIYVLTLAR